MPLTGYIIITLLNPFGTTAHFVTIRMFLCEINVYMRSANHVCNLYYLKFIINNQSQRHSWHNVVNIHVEPFFSRRRRFAYTTNTLNQNQLILPFTGNETIWFYRVPSNKVLYLFYLQTVCCCVVVFPGVFVVVFIYRQFVVVLLFSLVFCCCFYLQTVCCCVGVFSGVLLLFLFTDSNGFVCCVNMNNKTILISLNWQWK